MAEHQLPTVNEEPECSIKPDPQLKSGSFVDRDAQNDVVEGSGGEKMAGEETADEEPIDAEPISTLFPEQCRPKKRWSRRKDPKEMSKRPSWLPEGWTMELKTRESGATAGTIDQYYIEPSPLKRKFRSKNEVLYFQETGTKLKRKPSATPGSRKQRKIDEPSATLGSRKAKQSEEKNTKGSNSDSILEPTPLKNIPASEGLESSNILQPTPLSNVPGLEVKPDSIPQEAALSSNVPGLEVKPDSIPQEAALSIIEGSEAMEFDSLIQQVLLRIASGPEGLEPLSSVEGLDAWEFDSIFQQAEEVMPESILQPTSPNK